MPGRTRGGRRPHETAQAPGPRSRSAPGRRSPRGRSHPPRHATRDRKSTRLNSSHVEISYAVFCLKKKREAFRKQSAPQICAGVSIILTQFVRFSIMNNGFILSAFSKFFFFNDAATTEIYTLSLHDALPI